MRWEEGWVCLSYYLFDTTRLILLRSNTWEYRSEFFLKKRSCSRTHTNICFVLFPLVLQYHDHFNMTLLLPQVSRLRKDCDLMESHTLKLKNELALEADESASLRHKMRLLTRCVWNVFWSMPTLLFLCVPLFFLCVSLCFCLSFECVRVNVHSIVSLRMGSSRCWFLFVYLVTWTNWHGSGNASRMRWPR